jgi:hypothetical protein
MMAGAAFFYFAGKHNPFTQLLYQPGDNAHVARSYQTTTVSVHCNF